jgi:hypothetical protein
LRLRFNDNQLWIDRPEADGIAFTLRTRGDFNSCLKVDTTFGPCTDPATQWVGAPGGDLAAGTIQAPAANGTQSPSTEGKLSGPPVYTPLMSSDGKCVLLLPPGTRGKIYYSKSEKRIIQLPPLILCKEDDQVKRPVLNSKLNSALDSNCNIPSVGGYDPMAGIRINPTGGFQIAATTGGFNSTQSIACARKRPPKGPALGNRITFKRDQLMDWLANSGSALSKLLSRNTEMEEALALTRERALTDPTLLSKLTDSELAALKNALSTRNVGLFQLRMGKIMESAYAQELKSIFGNALEYVAETTPGSPFDFRVVIDGVSFQLDLTGGSFGSYLSHLARPTIDILIQYSTLTYPEMLRMALLLGL